jgi:branched-chain amino acid transport system substrate-binding protein
LLKSKGVKVRNRLVVKKEHWVVMAVALIALFLFAACGPTLTTPPEGGKMVEIADLTPLTGPTAAPEQIGMRGLQDYVRYFNEEEGIPGVTIELLWSDTGREMSRFVSAYRKFVARGVPFFFSDDTICIAALKSQIEKDRVPFVSGSVSAPVISPPGWAYCLWPTFGEVSTAVLDYFMENWQEERPAKVVYVGADDEMGRGGAEEVSEYAKSIGMEMLPWEFAYYVVVDATPQLLRIKEREADLVMIQSIVPAAAPILRDAERLGLLDKMQFAGLEFSMGETLMKIAGPAAEGYLAPRCTPWFDETEILGIKTIRDTQERYHGGVQEDPEYMGGWLGGAIMCEAIKRALGEVGYENLDGAAIKSALDGMKGFDVDGMAKITYTPEQRRGCGMVAVYQIQEGKIVRVSDWREVPVLVP